MVLEFAFWHVNNAAKPIAIAQSMEHAAELEGRETRIG